MSQSRLICASLFIASCIMNGCRPSAQPAAPDTSPYVRGGVRTPTAVPPPTSAPAQRSAPDPQAPSGTAEALAQRATSYAQFVEPLIAKRQRSEDPAASEGDGAGQRHSEHPADSTGHPTPQIASAQPADPPADGPASAAAVPQPAKSASIAAPARLAEGNVPAAPPHPDTMSQKLAQRAQDYPQDLSAQVDDQVLKLLRDDAVPESRSLAGLSAEDREVLSALMDSLSNFRNQLRADNNMLLSQKIRPLVELGDRVRGQAELTIPTVALCTSVTAFGVYEPIEPARFSAGRAHQVIIYCEVENFLSQLNDKGRYETRLSQDVVLYTEASGMPAWSLKRSLCVDLAHRRHHDFFMVRKTALPASLTIGSYLLKVTVEDEQAKHIAENTLPIEIVAQ